MSNPSAQRPQIDFRQLGIGSVLNFGQLVVPVNQREYAWEERHATELFQDYLAAFNEGEDHFLGTIVTIPAGPNKLEVVDGQQRLATTSLLLIAMRNYLAGIQGEELLVERINTHFLYTIAGRQKVPRLSLNVNDNSLYRSFVNETEIPETKRRSNELLSEAFELAENHVTNLVAAVDREASQGDLLDKWVNFIEHNAYVVLLQVPDGANAYTMFETLNDRGLRTSQADLVKNHIYGKAGEHQAEVEASWQYMLGALESIDEDDRELVVTFLRHALVLLRGYISAKEVFRTVEAIARRDQATVTLANHLETLSTTYVATFNPGHERWNNHPEAIRRSIEVFNTLNIKPLRALLLAIAHRMSPNEAAASYTFLVSLGVRLLIAATIRSGSIEKPISDVARTVFEGKITTAKEIREALKPITPSDQQFQEAFEIARVTTAAIGRYYLRALEQGATKAVKDPWFLPQTDPLLVSLEHVLPQRPEKNWPHISQDDVKQYSKRLGNLVLMRTKDNSDAKSASFAEKRALYAASPYELTSQIAVLSDWTPTEIVSRQKQLASIAVQTWPTQ